MSLLKPRATSVRISFSCPAELAERLKTVEDGAKKLALDFALDEHMVKALRRLVVHAERELASAHQINPDTATGSGHLKL